MMIRLVIAACCLWWAAPVEAAALTAEQIVWLKQNGVSEATIQRMCQSEVQGGSAAPDTDRFGVNPIVQPDGKRAIVYSTGDAGRTDEGVDTEARLKEERAWEMLRYIIVDTRPTRGRGPAAVDGGQPPDFGVPRSSTAPGAPLSTDNPAPP